MQPFLLPVYAGTHAGISTKAQQANFVDLVTVTFYGW